MAPGERVRVATRRGEIELMARRDPAVPRGMLFNPVLLRRGAGHTLTNPELDPFGKIPEFKFAAARVEKVALASAAE